MWRATFKSLLDHKLRLTSTLLAVALGVALVAGTYILTDTVRHTFTALFEDVNANTSVSVRAESGFSGQSGGFTDRATVPESLLSHGGGRPRRARRRGIGLWVSRTATRQAGQGHRVAGTSVRHQLR